MVDAVHAVRPDWLVLLVFAEALMLTGKLFSLMTVMKLLIDGDGPLKVFFC